MTKARRIGVAAVAGLLLAGWAVFGQPVPLVVSTEGGAFGRIQDAIDAAEDGSMIAIRSGTYCENLRIERPLTLLGGEGVTLEPEDATRPALVIVDANCVTIQGLRVRKAAVGIESSRSSFTLFDCSIGASDAGIRVEAREADTVSILNTTVQGGLAGTGIAIIGSGTVLLARCEFNGLATGVLIGGTGTTVALACTVEGCYEAVVLSSTTSCVLVGNTLSDGYANAIRLVQVPFAAEASTLCLIGNTIRDNDGWGLTLCGIDGTNLDASFGHVLGSGNVFSGNGNGPVCPVDLPLPEGFGLP